MALSIEHKQKIAELRALVIEHPDFQRAYQTIADAYSMQTEVGIVQNIICVGQSGTGKSTLKEQIENAYPRVEENGMVTIPVLIVDTPPVPTVKNLAEEMLIRIGDTRFNRGSAIDKTNRILHYLEVCNVKMIIFDELQHFIDQGKKRTPYEVSDWLKTVIDKAKVSTVLMGLDRSEKILRANEQLRRRFSKRIDIAPFSIDDHESRMVFTGVVRILDERVGLENRLNIGDSDLIKAIYFATNGIIDYLLKLFIGAYENAIDLNKSGIDRECLQLAFSQNIWVDGVDKLNPFSKNFIWDNLNKAGMPFHSVDNVKAKRRSK